MKAGEKLPDFKLANQDGKTKSLADYAGKWLVLYIYPKDDTPGCTIQGKSFTAQKQAFEKMNVQIVGLSPDDVDSHKDFCKKFSFTVELLADPQTKLLSALGAGTSEYKGVNYWNRTTFIVDPKGVIRKVYENVNPNGHEEALLRDLGELTTH